ncbi:hypothetical protein JSQ81_05895 [Sporosarcina sp. Marseille-Q4063]|uniref:hypothetical protein n=1 Tax=Sporosarcina sp. Marseille-Q4063 TaxID=2810514 RepID=UPI001BAE5C5E|nr:hypothetical protein [Sporosarcina sp. Marseille-Q4063]QUW23098.1 hypothetical protein JSQ81_05895 [Sporosarcina sp. Marseille-Q4063]
MNRKCTIFFVVIFIGLLSACSSTSNYDTDGIESIGEYSESKPNNDNTNEIELIARYGEGKADMEGIVLDIGEHGFKLARNLSPNEYEKIKNESVTKLHNEYVGGERENLGLIDLIYENENEFNKGDEVEVWTDGYIIETFPERAKAKKIVVKQ